MAQHPISERRRERGFSLRDLSEAAGVHFTRIHHLEHGREARPDELRRLARALGCRPRDLKRMGAER